MRYYMGVIAGFVFSLGLFAPQPTEAQSNPYFPLEPGLHCTFTSDMGGSPELFVTVTGIEQYFGQTVWAIQNNHINPDNSRTEFYSIGPDGDVFYHGQRSLDPSRDLIETVIDPPFCFLDMPVFPGKTWDNTYTLIMYINGVPNYELAGYIFSGKITATESPVTVPAGSFTAVEVAGINEHSSGQMPVTNSDYWFVADIGPVRREAVSDALPEDFIEMMWSMPLEQEEHSWGSVKALFR